MTFKQTPIIKLIKEDSDFHCIFVLKKCDLKEKAFDFYLMTHNLVDFNQQLDSFIKRKKTNCNMKYVANLQLKFVVLNG